MHLTARDKHLVLVDCHGNSVRFWWITCINILDHECKILVDKIHVSGSTQVNQMHICPGKSVWFRWLKNITFPSKGLDLYRWI